MNEILTHFITFGLGVMITFAMMQKLYRDAAREAKRALDMLQDSELAEHSAERILRDAKTLLEDAKRREEKTIALINEHNEVV